MSANQRAREDFLLQMAKYGMPAEVARLLLRHARTLQRIAEAECSDEAADRDRVMCPGGDLCACEHWQSTPLPDEERAEMFRGLPQEPARGCGCADITKPGQHHMVPRIAVQGARVRERVLTILAPELGKPYPDSNLWAWRGGVQEWSQKFAAEFHGDPRGFVLKVLIRVDPKEGGAREVGVPS